MDALYNMIFGCEYFSFLHKIIIVIIIFIY